MVASKIFAFHAPADCVFDILELMTGYYLMAFHSDPAVPDFPIPYEPDCLPHPRLFLPYKPRNLQNAYTRSCLEILKHTYEAVYAFHPTTYDVTFLIDRITFLSIMWFTLLTFRVCNWYAMERTGARSTRCGRWRPSCCRWTRRWTRAAGCSPRS